MSDEVLVEVDEHGVMLVTLNRPEQMNALNGGLTTGLLEAIDRASRDDDVRAMVLTGAGRAFCAGAEVTAGGDPTRGGGPATRHQRHDLMGGSGRTAEAFADCDVPIIGAINGATAGGGFGIALCCDVRFAAESARIGPIFMKRGVASDYGVAYWLPRIVGLSRALEIMYDGSLLDAARALDLGLVNRVFPDDRLVEETMRFARQVAAGPPLGNTYVRRVIHRSLELPRREVHELEWMWQAQLLRTHDAREGFTSFLERREPQFRGE